MDDDTLVRRRSRRSTAGNRMEAALAELNLEDVAQEAEEDNDFVIERDEEDVFGSDFESTDDEAAQQTPETGDKAVQEEERREKKTARSRVEKATALAHARQKVTFNPEVYEAELSFEKIVDTGKKKRWSLGMTYNPDTREVVNNAKRQSRRTHTILNTTASASRMKIDVEEKKAMAKKTKVKAPMLTQDELIARALDMEEGNIFEHRNYLAVEAEKRKRAHVVRTVVDGPLLRWVSKREEVPVVVEAPPQASPLHPPTGATIAPPASQRTETLEKNYVVHEISQEDNAPKPQWKDTMAALFGDSVDWENMKVYTHRGRPTARPVQLCPITGLPARYLDPRTNVPYATPAAYRILTKILKHEYVWSSTLGCYVAHESERLRQPVESDPTSRKRTRTKSKAASSEAMDLS